MIIPMREIRLGTGRSRQSTRTRPRTHSAGHAEMSGIERQVAQFRSTAVVALHGLILLRGAMSLWFGLPAAAHPHLVFAAIVIVLITIGLGYRDRLPAVLAFSADSVAVTLLLHGIGSWERPPLELTLVLVALGGFLLGRQGALAGGAVGAALLLLLDLGSRHLAGGVLAVLVGVQLGCGALLAVICREARAALAKLHDNANRQEREEQGQERMRQAVDWERLNLQINQCSTLDALVQLTIERAMAISGAGATLQLGDVTRVAEAKDNEQIVQIPLIDGEELGLLTVYLAPNCLRDSQRVALEQLALLVAVRVSAINRAALLNRQEHALTVLWQAAGVLRNAPDLHSALREVAGRLATALDLHWLALLSPDERWALAPLLLAPGAHSGEAPRLTGTQLRVAAEALRTECPLVRREGSETLACLPILLEGAVPLVLAARGAAAEATTQTLLMLFGDMVVERLASNAAMHLSALEQTA